VLVELSGKSARINKANIATCFTSTFDIGDSPEAEVNNVSAGRTCGRQ
jgi:hypothetical protein